VAGVSKEGLEGEYSKVALFSVVKQAAEEPLPLTVDATAVTAGIFQVSGRTRPGASVTVDGHEISVLPDGTFSEFVREAEGRTIVVRATGANGQSAEQKRTVAAN
jgi:hypothetical protein